MKTLTEAVNYVHNYITQYDQWWEVIDKNTLYEMMEQELLEAVEWILSDEDMKARVSSKDDTYLDKLLDERLEDYPTLLQEMSNDIISDYVLTEDKE